MQPFHQGPKSLQIVHMSGINHCIVISTMACKENEIQVYDSLSATLNLESETVIARYLNITSPHILMKFVKSGSTECGLYAIAVMTALAFR